MSLLPFQFVPVACVVTPLFVDSFALQVMNISVTHTFKIDKARAQLGYHPMKYDFADSVDHYMQSRPQPSNYQLFLNILLTLIITLILFFLSLKLDSLSGLHFLKERLH